MVTKAMDILVAYDVTNNKRRHKISKELEKIGIRINKSVFVCLETKHSVDEVYNMLKNLCTNKDSIFIFPLCKSCAEKALYLQHTNKTKREKKTNFV